VFPVRVEITGLEVSDSDGDAASASRVDFTRAGALRGGRCYGGQGKLDHIYRLWYGGNGKLEPGDDL
jgi:hypothetical protein